jgi:hypothetical protein
MRDLKREATQGWASAGSLALIHWCVVAPGPETGKPNTPTADLKQPRHRAQRTKLPPAPPPPALPTAYQTHATMTHSQAPMTEGVNTASVPATGTARLGKKRGWAFGKHRGGEGEGWVVSAASFLAWGRVCKQWLRYARALGRRRSWMGEAGGSREQRGAPPLWADRPRAAADAP